MARKHNFLTNRNFLKPYFLGKINFSVVSKNIYLKINIFVVHNKKLCLTVSFLIYFFVSKVSTWCTLFGFHFDSLWSLDLDSLSWESQKHIDSRRSWRSAPKGDSREQSASVLRYYGENTTGNVSDTSKV